MKNVFVATFILFFSGPALASSLKAYLENSAGLLHFATKQYFPAYQDFLRALTEDPLNPDLQLNLGLTFELNEEFDKAEKADLSAYQLSAGDKSRQFMALFNLAGARLKKEDVDGALQAYQGALEIEPESLEVKTNIELLWQSQQGKGKSKKDNKNGQGKDDKDQSKDQDDKDQKNKDKNYEQPKRQPKQFQSKELSKDDVRKILDEIQNQEKSIRAKEYDKGAKERKNDKDW